jgi:hypothetical protein
MFEWWPDCLPFIGIRWVYCDRYGQIVHDETGWECKIFGLTWFGHIVIGMQFDPPRRVTSDNECN